MADLSGPEESTLDAPRRIQVPNRPAPGLKGKMVVVMLDETEGTAIVLLSVQQQVLSRNIKTSQADLRVHLVDPNGTCLEIDVGRQVIVFALGRPHVLHSGTAAQRESSAWISMHGNHARTPQPVDWGCMYEQIA